MRARNKRGRHRVAVVQQPSVALLRDRTLRRGVALIDEAAGHGARLVAFPGTWVPGYPEWLWRLRPGDGHDLTPGVHARLREKAVDLAGGQVKPPQAGGRGVEGAVGVGGPWRGGGGKAAELFQTHGAIGAGRR